MCTVYISTTQRLLWLIKILHDLLLVGYLTRSAITVCEEVGPSCHGFTKCPQEAQLCQQELPTDHPGLCQCHTATVCSDRYERTLFSTQRHCQPSYHGEQVPRSHQATPTSHQAQRVSQLHHLLQCGIRSETETRSVPPINIQCFIYIAKRRKYNC